MSDLNSRETAATVVEVITRLVDRGISKAAPEVRYGVVVNVTTDRKVDVLLLGQPIPSTGFVYGTAVPTVGDRVRCVIDPRGDRYVADVLGRDAGLPDAITGEVVDARAGALSLGTRLSTLAKKDGEDPLAIRYSGFVNPYITSLWIAPLTKTNPTLGTQAIYTQLRMAGNMGGLVHDAMALEMRVQDVSNAYGLNAFETTVVVEGTTAVTIPDTRAITANLHFEGTPTGVITVVRLIASQTIPALPAGLSIGTIYGLYVEPQYYGTANWSIYAPTGVSLFGHLEVVGTIGFYGAARQGKQTVTGSRGGNAALASLLTLLDLTGLLTNSSTA